MTLTLDVKSFAKNPKLIVLDLYSPIAYEIYTNGCLWKYYTVEIRLEIIIYLNLYEKLILLPEFFFKKEVKWLIWVLCKENKYMGL